MKNDIFDKETFINDLKCSCKAVSLKENDNDFAKSVIFQNYKFAEEIAEKIGPIV